MIVTIKHFEGNHPSFNILLHSVEGAEPFLEIKGCRIANGTNGPFVSYPATKNEKTGKWWQHVYAGEKFNAHVLELAQGGQPERRPPPRPAPPKSSGGGGSRHDEDRDIPFSNPLSGRAFLAM